MSTVERPVTQITDTAVNSASASGVTVPSADAIGSENSSVNTRISIVKTRIAKREGLRAAKPLSAARARPIGAGLRRTARIVLIVRLLPPTGSRHGTAPGE